MLFRSGKIKIINSETYSLLIRGVQSNYHGVKHNYYIRIKIKEYSGSNNYISIIVYPNFTLCFVLTFILFGLIGSIYKHGFCINWYFIIGLIFFIYLYLYEFSDQRKRIIKRIVDIIT